MGIPTKPISIPIACQIPVRQGRTARSAADAAVPKAKEDEQKAAVALQSAKDQLKSSPNDEPIKKKVEEFEMTAKKSTEHERSGAVSRGGSDVYLPYSQIL